MRKAFKKNVQLTRRRISRVLSVSRKKGKPLVTTRAVLREFAQNTTLLGVSHVLRTRNWIWLLATVFCFAMSIVQSWGVAQQYFEQSTKQNILIVNQRRIPFPSVSVCTNYLLPPTFDLGKIPGYTDECAADEDNFWNNNKKAVLKYLRNITKEERSNLSLAIDKFVISCRFNFKKCDLQSETEAFIFHNPAWGNCLTLNPAFDEQSAARPTSDAKLSMELRFPEGFRLRSGVVVVYIHKPGSAPTFSSGGSIFITENRFTEIKMKLVERKFFRKRSSVNDLPTCISSTEAPYQKDNLYYTEATPYGYSLPACLKSCDQQLIREKCSVVDYRFPVQSPEFENGLDIQTPTNTCDLSEESRICQCPLTCLFLSYDVSYDTSPYNASTCSSETQTERQAKLRIAFAANYYESILEELDLSFTELLGILGGNMSLWTGLCFLSMLEVVELIWKLCKIWFRQRRSKISKSDPIYHLAPLSQVKPYKYTATSR